MKKHIPMLMILFLVIPGTLRLVAQQPEKVYSIVKEIHSFEWYEAQSIAWKAELDKDPQNGPGWIYYYTANRMARLTDRSRWEAGRGKAFRDLTEIAEMARKAMPGTYEALYITLYNSQEEYPGYERDLLKACELGGGRAEILDEMVLYYETKRNIEKRREYSRQWFRSNDIPAGIFAYNYNVLQTLEEDALIVTAGDNDTFPLWVLQDELGVKPRVAVLNIFLLTREDYRKKVFGELQIPEIRLRTGDHPGEDTLFAQRKQIVAHILATSKRPVYLALTLDTRYYQDAKISDDLYLTGLAMRYQQKEFDNVGVIRRHYENDYLLDYLRVGFVNDPSAEVVAQMNTGYLPMLVRLCGHYALSGEQEKLARVKQLMSGIAKKAGRGEDMTEFTTCE